MLMVTAQAFRHANEYRRQTVPFASLADIRLRYFDEITVPAAADMTGLW